MKKGILGVDKNIFFLGIVSFLTDISSEMIFSVFSIFFTVILGASTVLFGLVEGFADFSSSSLDYLSGYISDKTGKRKIFAWIGYSFSTLSKVLLLISSSVVFASLFRVVERLGKSFRGPPRDAWIATLAETGNKGYAFGLHKALDKAGAVLGPLGAYFLLKYLGQNMPAFKTMFIIALVPALLAVIMIVFIKDARSTPKMKENIFVSYKTLGKDFKHYLYSAGIFSLAYFSFGFLMLKAYIIGFTITDIVLLYALFNVSFVVFSIPIGKIGDKIGRFKIICTEYVLYFIMSLGFIFASAKWEIIVLFLIFGVFYAIDEGQSKAYITDMETEKKGTAIGAYNFFTGLVYLPASLIAGALWNINPSYAFVFAAVISVAALLFFTLAKRKNSTAKNIAT